MIKAGQFVLRLRVAALRQRDENLQGLEAAVVGDQLLHRGFMSGGEDPTSRREIESKEERRQSQEEIVRGEDSLKA